MRIACKLDRFTVLLCLDSHKALALVLDPPIALELAYRDSNSILVSEFVSLYLCIYNSWKVGKAERGKMQKSRKRQLWLCNLPLVKKKCYNVIIYSHSYLSSKACQR